jgi:hypothetical protein
MSSSHFFRLGTVNDANFLAALKHNKRELPNANHIDGSKTHLNYCLGSCIGNAKKIQIEAKKKMLDAGIEKPRKGGVMALEILFSLPIKRHEQDTKNFFVDCLDWALKFFPCELLSFDVHLDESAPHAHALLFPLVDGKMQGSSLLGGRGNIKRITHDWYQSVGRYYGLNLSPKKRSGHIEKKLLVTEVLKRLKDDCVMSSCIWPAVRDSLESNPVPYADLLAVNPPSKNVNVRSFVDIARSRGRGVFEK